MFFYWDKFSVFGKNRSEVFKFSNNFNSVVSKNYITLSVNSVAKNKNFSLVIIYIKFPLVAKISN